ncbi:iron complex transport system permease protein [Caldanaerobius fijiensis DSM 17918]|uniref:Iron complex transport system permease protein n=2 Tax=Caldanaerobius TaxID=862261 RepID=A0A1M4YQX3_9THEO|nr:iron chelate uptake ABC transporter family permease subunit [Caldanaerobius fijiensis]SHF07736.1 iron complex transport system permease protein [Caldanaerobius fijiensis DSM 17918]
MKKGFTYVLLLIILVLSMGFSAMVGAVKIPLARLIEILATINTPGLYKTDKLILFSLRIPRILESGLVGMALAVVGACFQGLLKNPMADPYVLGVSSGAAFGATIAIILGLGVVATNALAFLIALVTVFMVYIMAKKGPKVDMTSMLLAGVAVSAFLSSVISFFMLLNHEEMSRIVFWTMGSLSYVTWREVIISTVIILPLSFIVYLYSKELNALLTGEESAYHLGIDIEKTKRILLVIGSLITAAAVSVSGIIGFVGLIIPHIVRLFTGPDHRMLIPISAISGGIFLVWADTLSRFILSPAEIPIGIITSAVGGPFFLYLLVKNRRNK